MNDFDSDSMKQAHPKYYIIFGEVTSSVTYKEALQRNLKVMLSESGFPFPLTLH